MAFAHIHIQQDIKIQNRKKHFSFDLSGACECCRLCLLGGHQGLNKVAIASGVGREDYAWESRITKGVVAEDIEIRASLQQVL